ncbi:MAG: alpha/beta fold hydrolase [Sphingobacteriales bacterium]|jgi:predicted alpha/beta-fold hydrolase|nr:alpha/beta fold hydrolase [Sphingobacteriales bacterium]
MPVIQSSFKAGGLFAHKHFSTIYPALFRKVKVGYARQRVETPDGDFFDADILAGSGKKHLILMHGLEGSSSSGYILGMARFFNLQGYHVHALNFRSCSGELNRLPISYHSGFTYDIRFYIKKLLQMNPDASIYLCGFSLGGNALLRYLAEEGDKIALQIKGACAVSAPIDLKSSAEVLASSQNSMYMKRFLKSMKNKMKQKAKQFPTHFQLNNLDAIKTFLDFDNQFTAPLHGYANAQEYWQQCSSKFVLHRIAAPVLLLNALNDPFLHPDCFPEEQEINNPNLFLEYPELGGHVGFKTSWLGNYWIEKRLFQFYKTIKLHDQ